MIFIAIVLLLFSCFVWVSAWMTRFRVWDVRLCYLIVRFGVGVSLGDAWAERDPDVYCHKHALIISICGYIPNF